MRNPIAFIDFVSPCHRRSKVLGIFVALAMAGFVPSHGAFATTPLIPGQFLGQSSAIVTQAVVGSLSVGLGASSAEACPCRGTNGHKLTDRVSSLSIGPAGTVAKANVNTSTAYGLKTANAATTIQTTVISGINLLNGLVTAKAVKAMAEVDVTPAAFTQSYAGSAFTDLIIAGKRIDAGVSENTVVPLPGLGTVTVKFVNTGTYGNQAIGLEVEMLRIEISETNTLGLPVGAVIEVGEAYAGFNRVQPTASLGGYATSLAVTANAGSVLQAAASAGAFSGIGSCSGTNGAPVTATVANLAAPGLLTISTAATSAFGGLDKHASIAVTSSTISNISLLGGIITANGIEAVAQESRTGNVSTASTLGSTFGQLTIAGVAIGAAVPANTTISLAGIGYVVLNEQPPAVAGHIQVNGLHVVVSLQNSLGLPLGTELFIAHAEASATGF